MNKIITMVLFLGLLCGVTGVSAQEAVQDSAPEEPGKWEKAGAEIGEAANAVGDATVDTSKKAWKATKDGSGKAWDATKEGSAEAWEATKEGSGEAWDATKEGSAEAWDATKEKSQEMWEEGKAKLHDATAPEHEAPEVTE